MIAIECFTVLTDCYQELGVQNLEKLAHSQGEAHQGGQLVGQVQQLCEAVDKGESGKAGIGHPLGHFSAVHVQRQAPCGTESASSLGGTVQVHTDSLQQLFVSMTLLQGGSCAVAS